MEFNEKNIEVSIDGIVLEPFTDTNIEHFRFMIGCNNCRRVYYLNSKYEKEEIKLTCQCGNIIKYNKGV